MSLSQEECSICEEVFKDEDDLITTKCNHRFHRACAENRVKKQKTNCHVCKQPSVLEEALHPKENIPENTCAICKAIFDPKPDLITTSCCHTFHRTCAENRVKKQKTDCHVCKQTSALGNALVSNKPIVEGDCRICKGALNEEEDLIMTKCRHTFHRKCAERRFNEFKKSDCRICKKPGMFSDALFPSESSTEGECSICEEPLSHLVTTSCHHTFHRVCVQNHVNTENKTDCYVCHKDAALAHVLLTNSTTLMQSDTGLDSLRSLPQSQIRTDGHTSRGITSKKDRWQCNKCLMNNKLSHNRCESCGALRNARSNLPDDNSIKTPVSYDNSTSSVVQPKILVYITDLPSLNKTDSELTNIICQRIENYSRFTFIDIRCYSKLGVGYIRVKDVDAKKYLVETIGRLALSPRDGSATISFIESLNYVSYIVLNATNKTDTVDWPRSEVINRRWAEIYSEEEPHSCEQVDIQFPNIYRVVSSSFDQLSKIMENPDFRVEHNLFARVYLDAECSYLENLPKSITEDQIRQAIATAIGQTDLISELDLHIQLNKQTNNVCIIARKLTNKILYIESQPIMMAENLSLCLVIQSDPKKLNDDLIVQHKIFEGKAKILKRRGNNLILEISDKKIFNNCIKLGVLRVDDNFLPLEVYNPSIDPHGCEIDVDTWYQSEMLRYKPDIMQFVPNQEHKIFSLKWNPQIWLKEFHNVKINDESELMCQRLRVTVMLNTIATIRKQNYMIGDREMQLSLNKNMKTIIYNHESILEQSGPMAIKNTPFTKTNIEVINKDCLIIYEDLVKQGKNPVLLNMASATSPGGGYRKGDGAQEENLFRRSDYFRSLDTGLDQYIDNPSDRYHCTSESDLDPSYDSRRMYPIDEYGAIYTSGLTVFRRTENEGYAFMADPLRNVCSIAMPAYRHPALDGNLLSSKYAVGMRKKIENIFAIAYHHQHDSLVLSALGCGAFRNPPEHIAKIFRSVSEQYAGFFQLIIFAIVDDPNSKSSNFQVFYDELNGKIRTPFSLMNQPNTMIGPYRLLSNGKTVDDISIYDSPPCISGAKCNEIYSSDHASKYSHPSICIEQILNGKCTKTDDNVHMCSFIHRQPCKYGVQCPLIDDKKHAEDYEHPDFCPNGGSCADTSDSHEKLYRHLTLCKDAHKCLDFKTHAQPHCNSFRHYMPSCREGSYCVQFHDKEHLSNYKHPFPTPCRWTPYKCPFQDELNQSSNSNQASQNAREHCLEYAHVCQYGRNCNDTNAWHWEKWIHIARMPCRFGSDCNRFTQDDHLNSFTHPNIHDIRISCKDADKCVDRRELKHLSTHRHSMKFEDSGIVQYFHLNKDINFIQNQNDNIKRVLDYAKTAKWDQFTLKSIPNEILDWIRTLQPVHRCKIEIFESIILHGHVMSLDYMDNLSRPYFVANSVLQHSEIRQINKLTIPDCAEHARTYITALITDIFEKAGFKFYDGTGGTPADDATRIAQRAESIQREERILSAQINNQEHMQKIRAKTEEIAQASMKLSLDKSGIGYAVDKKLGTNKTVFSILGPHAGHYYGDIVLLLKRDILHHPDTNFTIQAGTSYHSGRCFTWRPWFGADPKVESTQIDLFHKTKLNPSIPGYDYATALELIAVTCHHLNIKPTDVDLDKVISRWLAVDSHQTIEAHLPPLIPLDYIEHIYIPTSIYKSLSANTRTVVDNHFKDCMTILDKVTNAYNADVVDKLDKRFRQNDLHAISRPIQGAVITIPTTNFSDHYVLPLTISQAYEQYQKDHPTGSRNSSIYIYWQIMNGDMMLTLSSKPIETTEKTETNSCLICYIAPKPTHHTPNDIQYHEETSYLNSGEPFAHSVFVHDRRFAGQSNEFYVGCNTDDVMTLCLEINTSTQTVTLSHAGPNSIYNHQKISCQFPLTQLDLTKLNFIHVSAGKKTVPIRNLFVTFEKQKDLHPTFDSNFKKTSSSPSNENMSSIEMINDDSEESIVTDTKQSKEVPGFLTKLRKITAFGIKTLFDTDDDSSLKPCPKSINCLIQFSDNASKHNSQFSHPCRFAELCRNPESNLTHPKDSHIHPKCSLNETCEQLSDPIHRAQYCHKGLPFYFIPCRNQKSCTNKSEEHLKKYSHGEEGLQAIAEELSKTQIILPTQQRQVQIATHRRTKVIPCKFGSECRDFADAKHRANFSHPPGTENKDNRIICKYGIDCYNHNPQHQAKYSHPST